MKTHPKFKKGQRVSFGYGVNKKVGNYCGHASEYGRDQVRVKIDPKTWQITSIFNLQKRGPEPEVEFKMDGFK